MSAALHKGTLIRHQSHFFFVDDITEHHSGQQRPTIHVTLRSVDDGHHVERTLDELLPVQEVPCTNRLVQYLYAKGKSHFFMDLESFEEVELSQAVLHGCEPFLKEGEEFRVLYAGEQPMRLEMPETTPLRVKDTAAPTHSVGTAGSVLKEAVLENGLLIHVPLFIKTGDVVNINIHSRQYLGKMTARETR